MPTVHLPTGTVHYLEHGNGVPLVLLHANPGDSRDFEAVIPALARQYRVIALDWPGYGQSDLPRRPESVSVMFYYKVLREFLAALSLPAAYFVGNSVGGNLAARLASESGERVRGLVLVAPGGFTPHNFLTRAFCRLQGSRFSLPPRRFAGLYLRQRTSTTEAMLERAATQQSTPERVALSRALWRSFGRPENDLRQVAQRIRVPTLLMFGEQDPTISPRRDGKVAAQCIPEARTISLPCGHAPFAEVPELFLAQTQAFLASSHARQEGTAIGHHARDRALGAISLGGLS